MKDTVGSAKAADYVPDPSGRDNGYCCGGVQGGGEASNDLLKRLDDSNDWIVEKLQIANTLLQSITGDQLDPRLDDIGSSREIAAAQYYCMHRFANDSRK
ncbi:unnamed protein product [Euphydryas editha]|uniref:Uncharacterized protein n=1 Tax=Euphydryas editha TaxID=104508 RepID=A0AAU9TZP9_EUPED|nr:unnamed protein product [Euphydryas editha]